MQINSDVLSSIAPYLSKLSHTPGRVRVRINPAIKSLNIPLNSIDSAVLNYAGILDVKINKIIASVTITYDPALIAPEFWDSLISGDNPQMVAKTIAHISGGQA